METAVLVAGGLLAGAVGGLLGLGGGIVLMPFLRFVMGLSPAYAAGTCILAVFFTTLGGSYRHYRLGHVRIRSFIAVIPAGLVCTVVFSLVFQYLATREKWLDLGLGLFFLLVSARMILESTVETNRIAGIGTERVSFLDHARAKLLQKVAIGAAGGALPGLLGIGTGIVLVPSFSYILGAPIKVAMGSSLTCFCANAFVSSSMKLAQGFIDLGLALPICIGTFLGANLGAALNNRFSSRMVGLLFGLVFSYVSIKFILAFFEVQN
jgi:uncharacterized membrane protein YfcA